MAQNNYLLQRVRQEDCLLALLPCSGGSVINPLKSGSNMYPEFNKSDQHSWAERNGLITTNNIIIKDNVFTAADPTRLASIKTNLNMHNNNTSKTFIAQAVFHNINDGRMHVSPLFNQGMYLLDYPAYVFNLNFRQRSTTGYFNISYSRINNTKVSVTHIVQNSFYDQFHTIAFVYEIIPGSETVNIKLYLDTKLVANKATEHIPWRIPNPPYDQNTLNIREDMEEPYLSDNQLAWAVIFDSALSAEEIALFK